MTEFYETRMGRTFYEHTVPMLIRQLERLNENLERLTRNPRERDDHDNEEEAEPPHARSDDR